MVHAQYFQNQSIFQKSDRTLVAELKIKMSKNLQILTFSISALPPEYDQIFERCSGFENIGHVPWGSDF